MIEEIKVMIANCLERMRARDCGTCERRDTCAALRKPRGRDDRGRAFLRMLFGEIGKAMWVRRGAAPTLRRQVEREVEPLLPLGPVRVDGVARALGCSRQTLYRRLKAEGLTFERILDDLRRRLALKAVRGSQASVKEIGYRLGFSDPAAFSRAFKRWTGLSPRVHRMALRTQASG